VGVIRAATQPQHDVALGRRENVPVAADHRLVEADDAGRRGVGAHRSPQFRPEAGLEKLDLVAAISGNAFGQTNALSSIVYVLVGVSAIALLPTLLEWIGRDGRAV
jgi:hypothetical protein